jgi:hypothetical protein
MSTLLRTTAHCPTETSASWLPGCCRATIPLSGADVTIVKRAGVKEGLLFPAVDHKLVANIGGAETSTQGLRATFKTWAEEQASHANEIIEMALGHAYVTNELKLEVLSTVNKKTQALLRPCLPPLERPVENICAQQCI